MGWWSGGDCRVLASCANFVTMYAPTSKDKCSCTQLPCLEDALFAHASWPRDGQNFDSLLSRNSRSSGKLFAHTHPGHAMVRTSTTSTYRCQGTAGPPGRAGARRTAGRHLDTQLTPPPAYTLRVSVRVCFRVCAFHVHCVQHHHQLVPCTRGEVGGDGDACMVGELGLC